MSNLREELKNIGQLADNQIKQRIGENLMYQIRNYERSRQTEKLGSDFLLPLRAVRLAWKPVGVFAGVALFFLIFSAFGVVAAQNAMPGDTLFAVKKIIEKSQALVAEDTARRAELAGEFFGNRVDELQQALVQESQLSSDGRAEQSDKVILAVSEVKKQLNDVNEKFIKLKSESNQDSQKTAAAVLALDDKIRSYKHELQQAKDKVVDEQASSQLNETLERAEEINTNVLEVIVDKHEKGELTLPAEDLQSKLDEHVTGIEEKVTEVEQAIADKVEVDGQELKARANQAKEKIAQAREAIGKNEYGLVLTLSKDSNEILKMLYGEINKVVENNVDEVQNEEAEVEGIATSSIEAVNLVAPVTSTTPEKQIEEKVIEDKSQEAQEFEVKIQ